MMEYAEDNKEKSKTYKEKALEYLRLSKETDDVGLSDHYYNMYIEYTFKGDIHDGK